jgi:UTP--glucose-1-phosphate uridylyltransferase
MRQMIGVYERTGGSVLAVEKVARARTSDYGIVAVRPGPGRVLEVADLVEKPPPAEAPSDLAIIGRYILMPEIFDHLEKTTAGRGGEIQLTDGLRSLLRRQPIHAYRFLGTRYDTGDKFGFLKATVEFALRRPDLGEPFRDYLKGLDLGTPWIGGAAPAGRRSSRPRAAAAARRAPAGRRRKRSAR